MKKIELNWRGQTLYPDEETCDVLIIGSGLAGLYCALKIDPGRRITILSKYDEESCNSVKAQGGIAAAIDTDDNPFIHFRDSMSAGAGRCNKEALKCLVGTILLIRNTTSAISASVPGVFQEVSFFTSQKQLLSNHLKILIRLASDLVPGTHILKNTNRKT